MQRSICHRDWLPMCAGPGVSPRAPSACAVLAPRRPHVSVIQDAVFGRRYLSRQWAWYFSPRRPSGTDGRFASDSVRKGVMTYGT